MPIFLQAICAFAAAFFLCAVVMYARDTWKEYKQAKEDRLIERITEKVLERNRRGY